MWRDDVFQKIFAHLVLVLYFLLGWTFWSGQCARNLSVWNGEVEIFVGIDHLPSPAPSTTSVGMVFWNFVLRAKCYSAFAETVRPHLPWVSALDLKRVQSNKLQ